MAQAKTIQLLRSSSLYESLAAAKTALQAQDFITARSDGELVLARYNHTTGEGQNATTTIKSVIGVYHKAPNLPNGSAAGVTFIEDVTSAAGSAAQLQAELDATQAGAGLDTDGSYIVKTGDTIIGNSTSLTDAVNDIADYIQQTLDKAARSNATTDGKVVVTVAQADGLVSETDSDLTDVKMGGYSKTSDTGAIAATDTLEQAFSKVENAIAKNTVSSTDNTVTINTTGTTTDLSVNIDGTTLVADSSTGEISTNLEFTQLTSAEVTALSDANVKEAYKLIYATDSNRTAIGEVIKVYKDSALQEVYLGASTDTINASTGVITKNTVTDPQSMNFAYQLADGTYSLTKIDVSKFLTQSEFGDGLSVSGAGVVSVNAGNGLEINSTSKAVDVKIDSTSESVVTAYGTTNTSSPVLSVSANGVKVSNIQNAIDAKVGTLDVTDTAVAGQYVSAVNETDGKVSMTRANVADAVLTGYSKGSAPGSGSEAVAATDDVKGAIAKLEHQVDAAVSAASTAVSGLDGTADATSVPSGNVPTADFQVLTKVVETDGVVQAVGATNGSTSATLKKLAATGAAADVSVAADATSGLGAGTVQGTLETLTTAVGNGLNSVSSGNGAIAVGTKSNKDQAISLVLDTSTTGSITSDMLEITSNGLNFKNTWDCGTF